MLNSQGKSIAVINRIKRISVVILLRKIFPFLIFLFIVFLSFLFGLWNIRVADYSDCEFNNVSKLELDTYISEYMGKNIFIVSPSVIEKKVLDSNGYIKSVYVKKVLPSKLLITFKEYLPFYAGYSGDSCLLFAKEGLTVEKVCTKCKDECKDLVKDISDVYIQSESVLESNSRLIFTTEFNNIYTILYEFGYESKEIYLDDGIATVVDMLGHSFIFDIAYDLDIQLNRVYLIAEKINREGIEFKSLDLRFERPVMKIK